MVWNSEISFIFVEYVAIFQIFGMSNIRLYFPIDVLDKTSTFLDDFSNSVVVHGSLNT